MPQPKLISLATAVDRFTQNGVQYASGAALPIGSDAIVFGRELLRKGRKQLHAIFHCCARAAISHAFRINETLLFAYPLNCTGVTNVLLILLAFTCSVQMMYEAPWSVCRVSRENRWLCTTPLHRGILYGTPACVLPACSWKLDAKSRCRRLCEDIVEFAFGFGSFAK